jgi:inner membrane transporter RhtA
VSFFVVSAIFHYLGPSLAVLLFARIAAPGVLWLRIAAAAAVFAVWRRPWRLAGRLDRRQLVTLLALGGVLAGMNALFYLAVARLLPAVAVVIGAVVLHQIPSVRELAGIALVIAGIAVHQADTT